MVFYDTERLLGKEVPDHVYTKHKQFCVACDELTESKIRGPGANQAMKCVHCGLAISKPPYDDSATGNPYIENWTNRDALGHEAFTKALEAMHIYLD